jgi:hypothetical protein
MTPLQSQLPKISRTGYEVEQKQSQQPTIYSSQASKIDNAVLQLVL